MNISNVWDLVGEDKKPGGSLTPSSTRCASVVPEGTPSNNDQVVEINGNQIDENELNNLIVEANTIKPKEWKKLKILRKYSTDLLNKFGVIKKKFNPSAFLIRSRDLDFEELSLYCIRPSPSVYMNYDDSRGTSIPKVVSSTLLKDVLKIEESSPIVTERFGKRQFSLADDENFYAFLSYTDHHIFERRKEYDPFCPLHGSKRNLRRHKNTVDMRTFVDSVDSTDNEALNPILHSQAFLAKIIRKKKRENLPRELRILVDKARAKIKINLWIISVALLFLYIAVHGLQNLQSSINGNLGTDSLAIHYLCMALSSLYFPPVIIHQIGCKQTLILGILLYICYMGANFYPSYYSLIPASILAGFGGGCLRAAQCSYIIECGIKYAKINVEAGMTVIVRFFGFFFMIVHLGQVIGNIMSSLIITAAVPYTVPLHMIDRTCGNGFIDNVTYLSERANENLQSPPRKAISSVFGVYICCSIISVMIIALFLNALKKDAIIKKTPISFKPEVLKSAILNLKCIKVILLIPLTIFNGFEQAFIVGLYTKAYVGCGLGISQIGFVMTSFGVADAICSLVFGPLIKLFGRMPLFVFGAVINMLMILTLLVWPINPGDIQIFYVIAGVWGMADGVWNTQINGFWIALVGNEGLDHAFAQYRFWESSGLAIALYLMKYTNIQIFLIISFLILVFGMICYFIIELFEPTKGYVQQLLSVFKTKEKTPIDEKV
ncbi:Protein unc-93 homolog A [Strongyloides ratti]|uniref:Protein unc-93 homolog A n=1 Tax=Strongyloides ratti TaxID=34506 RepID=A0A090KQA7_STRRB|nr:Protein unc-93 homolog A [Strongyloides ratti]CEF59569.1 Protein unc-93 homolog A [Strongyloides ratti]